MRHIKGDTFKTHIDLGDFGEVEVDVEYIYSPGTPDVMYMPNGDPGYPGDPAECNILSIMAQLEHTQVDLLLLFGEPSQKFLEHVEEEVAQIYAEREADYADYLNDQEK